MASEAVDAEPDEPARRRAYYAAFDEVEALKRRSKGAAA